MKLTESQTVEALQCRVPGPCSEDLEFLKLLHHEGEIFPHIEEVERGRIWEKLTRVAL
jgi:Protein of unknown function (DUF3723)